MSQVDDLLRQVTPLAERIRSQRAVPPERRARGSEDLPAMERRLVALWNEIRAARAATDMPAFQSRRAKWM